MSSKPPPVLVTGAASSIGRAIVARLVNRGLPVLAGVRTRIGLEAEPALDERGVEVIQLDVTRPDDRRLLATRLEPAACPAGLSGLVHCAGVAWAGPLECQATESICNLWEVNVFGWTEVTKLALPALRLGKGRILTVGSVSAHVSRPFLASYGASRLAVEALGEAWQTELAPWRIPFITVAAGRVRSELWARAAAEVRGLENEPSSGPTGHSSIAPYRPVLAALERWLSSPQGIAPERIAAAVETALTASRPRSRYRIGSGSWLETVLPLVPAAVRTRWLTRRIPPYGP